MSKEHYYQAGTAADDMRGMVRELEELRDFLIGVRRRVPLNESAIERMAAAEEAVRDMLYPEWEQAEEAIRAASDRDLEEADLSGIEDLRMPQFFYKPEERRCLTVDEYRVLETGVRDKRRPVATNPATRIAMGDS